MDNTSDQHPFGTISERIKLILLGAPMAVAFGGGWYASMAAEIGDGSLSGQVILYFISSILFAFFLVSLVAFIGAVLPKAVASALSELMLPVVRRAWLAILAILAFGFVVAAVGFFR